MHRNRKTRGRSRGIGGPGRASSRSSQPSSRIDVTSYRSADALALVRHYIPPAAVLDGLPDTQAT